MKSSMKGWRILIHFILILAVVVFAGAVIFFVMIISGKNSLANAARGVVPVLARSDMADKAEVVNGGKNWQEGDVRYQGVHYRYNADIMTFLFLGIDKMEEMAPAPDYTDAGRSDAIFLLAMDPHSKEISVIGINRDTMAAVDMYNYDRAFVSTVTTQICLQYNYGDGMKESCEHTVTAVSRLFYGIPITGYCALNMGAIPLLNDAVGGVRVTALENVPKSDIREGDQVLLQGMDAYYYLHNRDTGSPESARRRLERQKQYLTAYAGTMLAAVKANLTLPVGLYHILEKYMVTDVTLNEVSYLAAQAADYRFDPGHMYSLEGETEVVGDYEGFYPDERELYELILRVFYEEVDG